MLWNKSPVKLNNQKLMEILNKLLVFNRKKYINSSLPILKRSNNHEKKPTKSHEGFLDAKCNPYQN